MKINKDGFWEERNVTNYYFDHSLSIEILNICSDSKSVVDFGCGNAGYAKSIKSNFPNVRVDAFDGNPFISEITNGFAQQLNLAKSFDLSYIYDIVISLEVAEHIPKSNESTYVKNLISHCSKKIILSWAEPNQGGTGHVNEQTNDYVINLIQSHGLKHNQEKWK